MKYYQNKATGELLTHYEMWNQLVEEYDGDDATNLLDWTEYYTTVEIDEEINRYPEYIMKMLRQRHGYNSDFTGYDAGFNTMTPNEVFEEILNWNGIIGYAYSIKGWIDDIYRVDLNEK